MLVAVIAKPTLREVYAAIERAVPYADVLEIRFDALEEELTHLSAPLPLLFTFRRKETLSEEKRLAWIERLLELEPAYLDLEADTDPAFIEKVAQKFPRTQLIGSYHNFEETPDLPTLFASMQNPHFTFYKIAATAQSSLDLARLLLFSQEHPSLTCIAMGPFGLPSRVLGPIAGNPFDYAPIDPEPNRYDLKTLCQTYRYHTLNKDTQIYALLGDPVEQSPGPRFHNQTFQRNAVYVAIRLTKDELAPFLHSIRKLPFRGLSITMPLKEAILPYLDSIDPMAASIGAVNTVTIQNGHLHGTNTDGIGALNAIERHFPVQGKTIALLGSGGSARAIAFEAARRGAIPILFSRSPNTRPLTDLPSHSYDLLISTLPPTAHYSLAPRPAIPVMDIVYHPKETPLLQAAKSRNCPCIYGEEMWLEQARLQQQIWQSH